MHGLEKHGTRLVGALRSRAAQRLGLVVGIASIAALVVRLIRTGGSDTHLLETATPTSLMLGLGAFGIFQLLAIVSLRALHRHGAARLWATAQLVKYLPAPGSALFGMVGGAVRQGMRPQQALKLAAQHTLLLLSGASAIGAAAVPQLVPRDMSGFFSTLLALIMAGAGVLLAVLSTRGRRPSERLIGVAGSIGGWAVVGLGLWSSTAAGTADLVLVSSAFALAWIVGLLALPVPAGLGVREAVLLLLLSPKLGEEGAIAFGVVSRFLQIASDGLAACLVFGGVALASRLRRD